MAEFAPMPTASVRIATVVKAGFFFSMRSAYFRSCRNVCIGHGPPEGLYVPDLGLVHPMTVVLLVNTVAIGILAMNLLLKVDLHKVGRCLECNELLTLLSLASRRRHKAFYEAGSCQ